MTTILALHGYHGSATILRGQLAPVTAALPDVEFTFVDAPSRRSGDFGWWHEGFSGWERTRDWVLDLVAQQHFDGVLGFSQGAALTGLLAGVQATDPATALDFGFAVMIGGFTSFAPRHASLFPGPLTIPSLHVMGRTDTIVPIGDSLRLADRFADPVVLRHDGGHIVPNDPAIVRGVNEFITARAAHCPDGETIRGT